MNDKCTSDLLPQDEQSHFGFDHIIGKDIKDLRFFFSHTQNSHEQEGIRHIVRFSAFSKRKNVERITGYGANVA